MDKKLKESWKNLERAMTRENQKPRPQTNFADTRKAVLRRNLSIKSSLNSSNILNTSQKKLSSSFKLINFSVFSKTPVPKQMNISGISSLSVKNLHRAKCQDLKIKERPSLLARFETYVKDHFQNRKLEMKDLGIGINVIKEIVEILKTTRLYTFLNLEGNGIGDEGALLLAKSVALSPDIFYLNLCSNSLTPEGIESICRYLQKSQSLFHLDLSSKEGLHRNRACKQGAIGLYKLLKASKVLNIINLAGTSLKNSGLRELMEGIVLSSSLISLNLSNNSLTNKFSYMLSQCILKSNIKILVLSENDLDTEFCKNIADMLRGDQSVYCELRKLDLSKCSIEPEGAIKIVKSLSLNIYLESLILDKNPIGPTISRHLSKFFYNNKSLKKLSFNECRLTDVICISLCEGLKVTRTLKTLCISNNEITHKGVLPLSIGISANVSLEELDLSQNKIGRKGGSIIAKAIKSNISMSIVNLRECHMKDEAAIYLLEAIKTRQNFTGLNLEKNNVAIQYMKTIKEALRINFNENRVSAVSEISTAINKIKVKQEALEDLEIRQDAILIERAEEERKANKQMNKLKMIRQEEEALTQEVKDEYNQVHTSFISAAETLENYLKKKKYTVNHSEVTISRLRDNIQHSETLIEGLIYRKQTLKQKFYEKRIALKNQIDSYKAWLNDDNYNKNVAENNYRKAKITLKTMMIELMRFKNNSSVEFKREKFRRKKAA